MPCCLYISDALGRENNFVIIKLYISSIKNMEHIIILTIINVLSFILLDNHIKNGNIQYIKNNPDNPKKTTLLKHTNPPIFPKFNISSL